MILEGAKLTIKESRVLELSFIGLQIFPIVHICALISTLIPSSYMQVQILSSLLYYGLLKKNIISLLQSLGLVAQYTLHV